MDKKDLMFYYAYEAFYKMAKRSNTFALFCRDAFGEDFSQDGFSNAEQTDMILEYIPKVDDVHILDIGCGNGKMLGYLQDKTNAFIYGFDYSEEAINTAKQVYPEKSEFKVGIIGETEYPKESFDVIISMDSMYFAKDMTAFVSQIKKWLKRDGVFFAGYQEGDVVPKTENVNTTELAKALKNNSLSYTYYDITDKTYELLKQKQQSALKYKNGFEAEGFTEWFDMLIGQTGYADCDIKEFRERMARYIYIVHKQ